MTKQTEYDFRLTHNRSLTNKKYKFEFLGNSEKAIVPVLQRYNTEEYNLIGTASYFIAPNIFITAAHIFVGRGINQSDTFHILLNDMEETIPIITRTEINSDLDIVLFEIDQHFIHCLNGLNPLGTKMMPPYKGEVVGSLGFSHTIVDPDNIFISTQGDQQLMKIRSKWELGGVLEIHNQGCRQVRGECYETSVLAEGRDSGAPLFNSSGFFIGLLSTSLGHDDEQLPNSIYASILQIADDNYKDGTYKDYWYSNTRSSVCRQIT